MSKTNIIGVFDEEDLLVGAIGLVKEKDIRIKEMYTPYPIHAAIEAIGTKTIFKHAAFIYGVVAAAAVLLFLHYTVVWDWPMNFGGKPFNAFPSFIIITIVLTILSVTILSLLTFSIRAKIYPGKVARMPDTRSTDDKFVMVFDKENVHPEELTGLLQAAGASEVYEKDEDSY
jgi:hypothetical protein